MTDEIFFYVDGYQGNGFNEKFENIILDAMVSEAKRKERIKSLDVQIEAQSQQLRKLLSDCDAVTRIRRQAMCIERDLDLLQKEVVKLLPEEK